MSKIKVRPMKKNEIKEIANFMADSFLNDPLYEFFIPEKDKLQKFMKPFFAFRLRFAYHHGKVYVTDDKKAVVAWIPPGIAMKPKHLIQYRGIGAILGMGKENRQRFMEFSNFATELEKEVAPQPHWEMSPIAVHKDYWGKGYAKTLILHMLKKFDENRQDCFLLTQTKKNKEIYQKFGFELKKEATMESNSMFHYAMLRSAKGLI